MWLGSCVKVPPPSDLQTLAKDTWGPLLHVGCVSVFAVVDGINDGVEKVCGAGPTVQVDLWK
ncbi:hypothetical protein L484_011564 [Morus notabilis]|uniref:Uncharacterized protein n=1 Tax=Morus notabilis TaxID=981085 RepID=W9RZ65_9ROSA|nr:hypothetical protein L484_011564 [Morus notabilis]